MLTIQFFLTFGISAIERRHSKNSISQFHKRKEKMEKRLDKLSMALIQDLLRSLRLHIDGMVLLAHTFSYTVNQHTGVLAE